MDGGLDGSPGRRQELTGPSRWLGWGGFGSWGERVCCHWSPGSQEGPSVRDFPRRQERRVAQHGPGPALQLPFSLHIFLFTSDLPFVIKELQPCLRCVIRNYLVRVHWWQMLSIYICLKTIFIHCLKYTSLSMQLLVYTFFSSTCWWYNFIIFFLLLFWEGI